MNLPFPSWAEVDLDRLHSNVDIIHAAAGKKLLPVIKANAYGHGGLVLARELAKRKEVEALAVWSLDEAEQLRKGGIKCRVLALGGFWPAEAGRVVSLGVEPVISSSGQASLLARAASVKKPAKVHFKIDTGMARLGEERQAAFDSLTQAGAMGGVRLAGVMTHLAFAECGKQAVRRQLSVFDDILASFQASGRSIPPRHAANTAAVFLHPEARYDLVRPGIGLYGVKEFRGKDPGLKPVLSLRARVIWTRKLAKGETVSYFGIWESPGPRKIAVVSLGYADGYSRVLSNRVRAIIKGKSVKQIGVICMDSATFDVTSVNVKEGDTVTIIGSDGPKYIGATAIAKVLSTISYEILCGIGNRTRRIYIRSGKIDRRVSTGI